MKNDSNKKNKLMKKLDHIKLSPGTEHVLNIIKAALASFPVGASIASLMTDYIPNSKFRRLEEFIFRIADDLRRLGNRIEQKYIRTDEFAYMFEQSFRGVGENYQQEKIDAFRGILLNSAIRQDIIQDEKEFFLSLVNNLSVLHIRILKFLASPNEYIQEIGIEPNSMQGGFRDMFRILMPELDTSIIESAFGDLFGLGLISTPKTIFHSMTSGSGLRLFGDRVADLGRRFIDFCRVP